MLTFWDGTISFLFGYSVTNFIDLMPFLNNRVTLCSFNQFNYRLHSINSISKFKSNIINTKKYKTLKITKKTLKLKIKVNFFN